MNAAWLLIFAAVPPMPQGDRIVELERKIDRLQNQIDTMQVLLRQMSAELKQPREQSDQVDVQKALEANNNRIDSLFRWARDVTRIVNTRISRQQQSQPVRTYTPQVVVSGGG